MKLNVERMDVWAATIEDQPGGLHEKLEVLAGAGANLEFVISRRAPDQPGQGVLFVTPIEGAKQSRAAEEAGFKKSAGLHSLRVEGMDKPGVGAVMTEAMADAGLNLRGFSAAAFGRQFIAYLALDTAEDAAIAIETLKRLSSGAARGGQRTRSRSKGNRLRSLNNPRHRQRSIRRASRRRSRTV
jgi:hypothetical protein